MIEERRASERVRADIPVRWEGVLASREGTAVDISTSGCFILTEDAVQPKELIRLEMQLPTGRQLFLWGEVVYTTEEMGFALRFTGIEETEMKMLEFLIEYARGRTVE